MSLVKRAKKKYCKNQGASPGRHWADCKRGKTCYQSLMIKRVKIQQVVSLERRKFNNVSLETRYALNTSHFSPGLCYSVATLWFLSWWIDWSGCNITKNSIAFLYQIGTKLRNIFYKNELSVRLKSVTRKSGYFSCQYLEYVIYCHQ